MPKVVLIGFMASGKSTVAARLASLLGVPVREMDDLIIARSSLPSIPAIFEQHGEPFFRNLESAVAASLRTEQDVVISTGGGVISRPENMDHLSAGGAVVVFLRSSFETAEARSAGLGGRPLFRDGKRARALFEERAPLYARWADITIDTDSRTIDDICAQIASHVEQSVCRS